MRSIVIVFLLVVFIAGAYQLGRSEVSQLKVQYDTLEIDSVNASKRLKKALFQRDSVQFKLDSLQKLPCK